MLPYTVLLLQGLDVLNANFCGAFIALYNVYRMLLKVNRNITLLRPDRSPFTSARLSAMNSRQALPDSVL